MIELRKWYRANGICVSCGQENAVQGQARCFRCREKVREANRRNYAKHRSERNEKYKQYHKERTASLRAQGVCTRCGRRKPETGKARCAVCNARSRRQYAKRSKNALPRCMFGDGKHCSTCGKPVNGTKLCPRCLANAQRTIKIARQHIQTGWQYEPFVFGERCGR